MHNEMKYSRTAIYNRFLVADSLPKLVILTRFLNMSIDVKRGFDEKRIFIHNHFQIGILR